MEAPARRTQESHERGRPRWQLQKKNDDDESLQDIPAQILIFHDVG